MHKITNYRGTWKPDFGPATANKSLLKEKCPNPGCNKKYVYPTDFQRPYCTGCKQMLFGIRFHKKPQSRINYYLELLVPGGD